MSSTILAEKLQERNPQTDSRTQRALELVQTGHVALNDREMTAVVTSQSAPRVIYHVDLIAMSCDCPDHAIRGRNCKHIIAAEMEYRRRTTLAKAALDRGRDRGAF